MNAKTPWYSNVWVFFFASALCWPVALYMIFKNIGNDDDDDDGENRKKRIRAAAAYNALD